MNKVKMELNVIISDENNKEIGKIEKVYVLDDFDIQEFSDLLEVIRFVIPTHWERMSAIERTKITNILNK